MGLIPQRIDVLEQCTLGSLGSSGDESASKGRWKEIIAIVKCVL